MDASPLDPKLFELVSAVVKVALNILSVHLESKGYLGTYFQFPELTYFENGMPRIGTVNLFGGPKDYTTAFDKSSSLSGSIAGQDKPPLQHEPAFKAVMEYFRNNPALWKHLFSSRMPDKEHQDEYLYTETKLFITYLVDRYMHIYKTSEFSASDLLPLYIPLEAEHLQNPLPVNIWVPILFVKFATEEVSIDKTIFIRRISEKMHLARAGTRNYGLAVHELVMGAATHAFVLTGFDLANSEYGEWQNIASTPNAYPVSRIEFLFSVLRLVTGIDTGYAQLLLEPRGWASSYRSDLPYLTGTSVRKYPPLFEDYYWSRPTVPEVSEAALEEITAVYRGVNSIANEKARNRILLAASRLNYCLLRENEEDAILDATSGLEVLLTPSENSEITHKLATRLAGLTRFAKYHEGPSVVFRNVKTIYGHRSNVVHGNFGKLNKTREICLTGTETVPTVKFASDYLRLALRILIASPHYLDPSRIDEELLLGQSDLPTSRSRVGQ